MLKHLCNNQQMWEILWSTIYLLSNIYMGSGKCGNVKTLQTTCRQADRQVTVYDITNELCKTIKQVNHTNQSHNQLH